MRNLGCPTGYEVDHGPEGEVTMDRRPRCDAREDTVNDGLGGHFSVDDREVGKIGQVIVLQGLLFY